MPAIGAVGFALREARQIRNSGRTIGGTL